MVTIIPFLFTGKALFYRERASRMYSAEAHAIAANVVEDPYIFVEVTVIAVTFYWLCGFVSSPTWVFFYFWLILWLFVMLITYLGMFYAALLPTSPAASLVGTLSTQLLGLASGVLVLPSQIPNYLLWL